MGGKVILFLKIFWYLCNAFTRTCLLFVIMITDYITGLSASKKEGQKFPQVKKGTGWVFPKFSYLVYLWGVNCFVEHLISKNLDIFTYPVFILHIYMIIHILLWETKSIDENLERLGYNFKILKIFDNVFTIFKKHITKKRLKNENK